MNTEDAAYEAVLAKIDLLKDIEGIELIPHVIENDGTFVVQLIVVLPEGVDINGEQQEILERFTDLDEKSDEIKGDFEEAEDLEDEVAAAIGAAAISSAREELKNVKADMPEDVDVLIADNDSRNRSLDNTLESDLTVEESSIGEMDSSISALEIDSALEATQDAKRKELLKEKEYQENSKRSELTEEKSKTQETLEPEVA